jgi:hypothetical protein
MKIEIYSEAERKFTNLYFYKTENLNDPKKSEQLIKIANQLEEQIESYHIYDYIWKDFASTIRSDRDRGVIEICLFLGKAVGSIRMGEEIWEREKYFKDLIHKTLINLLTIQKEK